MKITDVLRKYGIHSYLQDGELYLIADRPIGADVEDLATAVGPEIIRELTGGGWYQDNYEAFVTELTDAIELQGIDVGKRINTIQSMLRPKLNGGEVH